MSGRGVWATLAVSLIVLAAIATATMWPTSASGYRDEAVTVARDSLAAVRTVILVAGANDTGSVSDPYTTVVLDNARTTIAKAQRDLSTEEVPDAASASLRDELSPLLGEASSLLGDDDTALHSRDQLSRVGDRLAAFVAGQQ